MSVDAVDGGAASNSEPTRVSAIIRAWLKEKKVKPAALARQMGIPRAFLGDVLADRRNLPDDRISLLPTELILPVARANADAHHATGRLVLHAAIQMVKKRVAREELGS
jgi:hypothetical protein